MKEFIRKISSRKLWAAAVGLIVGMAAAFGLEENDWAQVAGIVTSAMSVVSYILGEAQIDSAAAGCSLPDRSEDTEEHEIC